MLDQLQRAKEISAAGIDSLARMRLRAPASGTSRSRGGLAVRPRSPAAPTKPRSTISAASTTTDRSRCWWPPRPRRVVSSIGPDSKRMNFEDGQRNRFRMSSIALLERAQSDDPAGIAMQAISAPDCLPGLEAENPNPFVPDGTQARVWIGNAGHGRAAFRRRREHCLRRRRAPPLHPLPARADRQRLPGADGRHPGERPDQHGPLDDPRARPLSPLSGGAEAAFVADLEPGDAIYIPYLWWHGVQSLDRFNILVNNWFEPRRSCRAIPLRADAPPRFIAPLSRHGTPEHRHAWRALYDHYVFQTGGDPMNALDSEHHETIGPIDAARHRPSSGKRCANCLANDASRDPTNSTSARAPDRLSAARRAPAPTLLFLPGYASDMEGTKALALDAFAERRGARHAALRLFGHRLERRQLRGRHARAAGSRKRSRRSTS